MIRLFFAAFLPSLLAVVMVPGLTVWASAPAALRTQEPPKADAVVALRNNGPVPAVVTIQPGQTIRWINSDNRDYSLVSGGEKLGDFRSGTLKPGGSWTYTFPDAGTFDYGCALRPRASGTVKVGAAAE